MQVDHCGVMGRGVGVDAADDRSCERGPFAVLSASGELTDEVDRPVMGCGSGARSYEVTPQRRSSQHSGLMPTGEADRS